MPTVILAMPRTTLIRSVTALLASVAVFVGIAAVAPTPARADDVWFTGMLRSMPHGQCLDGDAAMGDTGNVLTQDCHFGPSQQWQILLVQRDGQTYAKLRNMRNGYYIVGDPKDSWLITYRNEGSLFYLEYPYADNGSIVRFHFVDFDYRSEQVYDTRRCLDANSVDREPIISPCGSIYQDWHQGF